MSTVEGLTRRIERLTAMTHKWRDEARRRRVTAKLLDPEESGGRYCGCYLLLLKGKPVYAGQSINVFGRIAHHRVDTYFKMKFDEVRITWCAMDQLDEAERALIELHQPTENRAGVHKPFLPRRAHQRTDHFGGANPPSQHSEG